MSEYKYIYSTDDNYTYENFVSLVKSSKISFHCDENLMRRSLERDRRYSFRFLICLCYTPLIILIIVIPFFYPAGSIAGMIMFGAAASSISGFINSDDKIKNKKLALFFIILCTIIVYSCDIFTSYPHYTFGAIDYLAICFDTSVLINFIFRKLKKKLFEEMILSDECIYNKISKYITIDNK